jgi:hypothetical protein
MNKIIILILILFIFIFTGCNNEYKIKACAICIDTCNNSSLKYDSCVYYFNTGSDLIYQCNCRIYVNSTDVLKIN